MAMRKREDEVYPNAAGTDVGASSHWVAVPGRLAEAPGCEPVREFGALIPVTPEQIARKGARITATIPIDNGARAGLFIVRSAHR